MVRLILKEKKNLQEAVQPRTYGDVKKAIKQILLKKKGGALGGVLTDQVVGELVKLIPVVGKAKVAYDLVKAIYSATDSVKTNTILDKINVDDDYSKIVDDKLEMAFLKSITNEIMNEPNDNKSFDDFNVNTKLTQFLAANYNNKTLTGTNKK